MHWARIQCGFLRPRSPPAGRGGSATMAWRPRQALVSQGACMEKGPVGKSAERLRRQARRGTFQRHREPRTRFVSALKPYDGPAPPTFSATAPYNPPMTGDEDPGRPSRNILETFG